VTPKTWQGLMEVVKRLRPGSKKELERLETLRQMRPEFFRRPGIETLAEERDAVNLALRMSDFDKKEILKWTPPEEDDLPPFVQGLQSATLIEDQMIAHDAEVFGDWGRLKRYQVGYAVFNKGQERLTVMNVNRHNVERTLGVDLFYYHYRYDAYVMVQYKRMMKEKEAGGAVYRLNDKSYRHELERMQEFERILKRAEPRLPYGLRDYRLHAGTSYFKLCPGEIFDLASTDMMKGMYLPLDYWEMLIRSPEILGPQGGERITYDNVDRYFNNTLFVELVQAGWIGSRLLRTEVLTDLARNAINGNRSLLLAAMRLARAA
jgi:hypothetical protein